MQPPFTPQLSVPQWLSIPVTTRIKLRQLFDLKRSEGSHVTIGGMESKPTSDGHTGKDLAVITLEKLQQFTGDSSPDFFEQFNLLVSQLSDESVESTEEVAKKMNEERLRNCTIILKTMKQEAKDFKLEEDLVNLLTLAHGQKSPEVSTNRKGTRRSSKA